MGAVLTSAGEMAIGSAAIGDCGLPYRMMSAVAGEMGCRPSRSTT